MTSQPDDGTIATLCLRLLLGHHCSYDEIHAVEWEKFHGFLQKNVILLRMNELLKQQIDFSESWRALIVKEEKRIKFALTSMAQLGTICDREGVRYIFPKALWHYPDMGHDIDLLIESKSVDVDEAIKKELPLKPAKKSLTNRLAGKIGYEIDHSPLELEIHHGRMGHLGENDNYPTKLIERRMAVLVDGQPIWSPSIEDQLIIAVLQRMYGHFYFRISDLLHALTLLKHDNLNWNYIFKTVERMGVQAGLTCYIGYINGGTSTSILRMKKGVYPLPQFLLPLRLYGKKWVSHFMRCQWESFGRVTLMPFLSISSAFRWAFRKIRTTPMVSWCRKSIWADRSV